VSNAVPEHWRERYLVVTQPEPRPSVTEPPADPDLVRLNAIQGELVDQLVARRQATTGPKDAGAARRLVIREVLAEGILAVQRREGISP
jgi:hypothetical protein